MNRFILNKFISWETSDHIQTKIESWVADHEYWGDEVVKIFQHVSQLARVVRSEKKIKREKRIEIILII